MAECRFCTDGFTPEQITEAKTAMALATKDLGPLTLGQSSDLLLDNLSWLENSIQARHLVVACMED